MAIPKKLLIPFLLAFPLSAYVTIITIAYSTDAGADDNHAYERSKEYDTEKAQMRAFDKLGLSLTYVVCDGKCVLSIVDRKITEVLDSSDAHIQDVQSLRETEYADGTSLGAAIVVWKRPSDATADFQTHWPAQTQHIELNAPQRGRWQVVYTGLYKAEVVRSTCDVFIPQ